MGNGTTVRIDDERKYRIKRRAKDRGTTKFSAEVRNLLDEALDRREFAERLLAQIQESQLRFEQHFLQRLADTQRVFEERLLAALEAALKPEQIEQLVVAAIDKKHELFRGF